MKQAVPLKHQFNPSEVLLVAESSADSSSFLDWVVPGYADVNCVEAVTINIRKCDVVLRGESPMETRVEYQELKADVTPLFLAVHIGSLNLVRNLLSVGADVNQKLFRGYATTAASRECHVEILEMLVKAGASQPACEEALIEACIHGWSKLVGVLMSSDLIRPHIAVQALSIASCRGFVDVVDALIKCGVDINANCRILLQSSTPSLHCNIDCSALVAAIVSRQLPVVSLLLKAGATTDRKIKLGSWSWDLSSGEEIRVGAGLSEPYDAAWCAVEYFEATGSILRLLLQRCPVNAAFQGRTLLHHAVLCGNVRAVDVLLSCGADIEVPVNAVETGFRALHVAARVGLSGVVSRLIESGCDINSVTESGDSALMIACKYRNEDCFMKLTSAGADFGLVNQTGLTAWLVSQLNNWSSEFQRCFLDVAKRVAPVSSNMTAFDPLKFVTVIGDVAALSALIKSGKFDLDRQDDQGFSAAMHAVFRGYVDAFQLLVKAGADVKKNDKEGRNAVSLFEENLKRDELENVILQYAIEKRFRNGEELHYASRRGDVGAVKLLLGRGYDVDGTDKDGNTPLMVAAKGGHAGACEALIAGGADCEMGNARGETAMSVAGKQSEAGNVILEEMGRRMVLRGSYVMKYTKNGKGKAHGKRMEMRGDGVLRWGTSKRRNVVCVEAAVGPSEEFRRNRGDVRGVFRVMTNKNKEYHFACDGGNEMCEMWVRGIMSLISRGLSK